MELFCFVHINNFLAQLLGCSFYFKQKLEAYWAYKLMFLARASPFLRLGFFCCILIGRNVICTTLCEIFFAKSHTRILVMAKWEDVK